MCGRIALYSPPSRLARLLEAQLASGLSDTVAPSWNTAPQQTLFGVSIHDGVTLMEPFRWGLVPHWAKDSNIGNKLFNARSETAFEKPSFREAFAHRPCLIPIDGFYEWDERTSTNKQPYYFTRRDEQPLVLAGLYEHWRDPHLGDDATVLATCTVLTTSPNADIDDLHHRMPVILEHDDRSRWLTGSPTDRLELCAPSPASTLKRWPVDRAVGSVRNNSAALITPVAPSTLF